MDREEQFDSFYRATRRDLLHQAFVLTGNLAAAQSAVRDAYVAAWHHWRKASTLADPQDWVRPRAWRLAQRRATARLWSRNKGLSERDRAVLDAVTRLPVAQRRVLVLTQLAAVPLTDAARELGITREAAEQNLQSATANFAVNLDVDSTSIRPHLQGLDGAAADAPLPRPSIVRRAGRKRRQGHTFLAVAAAVAVTVASGAVAYQPARSPAKQPRLVSPPDPAVAADAGKPGLPTPDQLLDVDQVARLGPGQTWKVLRTHDNTSGTGINTVCQQSRFADPDGVSALVRSFTATGRPSRSAVQTVEVSRSADEARKAFDTTVGWYAGGHVARLQLLDAYRVDGVGDAARVLTARVWGNPVTTYSVAVARVGTVTTSTVAGVVGGRPAPPRQLAQSLADAVSMLCATSGSGDCAKQPTHAAVPPPPSGEERGILAVPDLPPVGAIDKPWVGTRPRSARVNPAATTCDRADFARAGATRTRTRTFLVPQARLPDRFGLSESYGVFPSSAAARRFLAQLRERVAGCEDRSLATHVSHARTLHPSGTHLDVSTWQVETDVSDKESVMFRLGFVRVGDKVAQVTFSPTSRDDISASHFVALMVRAGDRLRELG